MRSFVGVPIVVDRVPDGSLYLTEKTDGQSFTHEDQESVLALAGFAGVAIERSRRQTAPL
jgi:GAF domain-containing protein